MFPPGRLLKNVNISAGRKNFGRKDFGIMLEKKRGNYKELSGKGVSS